MTRITFMLLAICLFLIVGCKQKADSQSTAAQTAETYEYLIDYPDNYKSKKDSAFSLLIFLHGAGERGTDISKVRVHGPPKQAKAGMDFPAIVFSPQCPEEVWWDVNRLEVTLQKVLSENRVDRSRVFLTGLSMGGYGTFNWAAAFPEHFAAIAPICGGGEPENAKALVDTPTWVFHGAKDKVVPLTQSSEMVDAIQENGGEPKFTVYPEANHNSWTVTYDNPEFYQWLFSHTKPK